MRSNSPIAIHPTPRVEALGCSSTRAQAEAVPRRHCTPRPIDGRPFQTNPQSAPAGFTPVLAYVRHAQEFDPRREELAKHDAEQRLQRGAALLGDPESKREVLFGASTGEGLGQLAERAGASLVVFGSDYRTAPGH